jgi:GTP-binding protein HflX
MVMNKADLVTPRERRAGTPRDAIRVSALEGDGLPELLSRIEQVLDAGLARVSCALPSDRGDVVAWLRRSGRVVEEYYRDGVVTVTALVPPSVAGQLHKQFPASTRGG